MNLTKPTIEILAQKFRIEHGLSSTEPISFNKLLLKLNVLTLFRPLSDNFSGMSLKDFSGNRFMLVNSNHIKARQHFTIAHELYHLYIEESPSPHQCNSNNEGASKNERYADQFATALLMPKDAILSFLSNNDLLSNTPSIASIIKMEQYFGVSHSTILIRLLELKFINKSVYDQMSKIPIVQTARKLGFDTSLYKKGNNGNIIGDYSEIATKLFEKEKISEGHYWELLSKISSYDHEEDEDDNLS